MSYQLRKAITEDHVALEHLITRSARELGTPDYTPEQIEGALRGTFGVDTQLVNDGTYFVVEEEGHIVGCGGWSWRRTLFGGDAHTATRRGRARSSREDAAKIRAFFVHP